MELMVRGPGNIPLLPITWDDLKAIADVLKGYLAYVRNTMPVGAIRHEPPHECRGLVPTFTHAVDCSNGATG